MIDDQQIKEVLTKYGIAITGGIASGKSSASFILRQLGFNVIDADTLAHRCLEAKTKSYDSVVDIFGTAILDKDQKIDRKKLGSIVFADPKKKEQLESILHPHIRHELHKIVGQQQPSQYFFYDAALIFETNSEASFCQTWLIACSYETQLYRLITKRQMAEQDAHQRIIAQMPISDKIKRTEYVIWNESSLSDLKKSLILFTYQLKSQS